MGRRIRRTNRRSNLRRVCKNTMKRKTMKRINTRKKQKLIGGENKGKRNHTELQSLLDNLSTMVRLSGNNSPNANIYFNDDKLSQIIIELNELKKKLVLLPGNRDMSILPTLAEFIDQGGEVPYVSDLEEDGSVVYEDNGHEDNFLRYGSNAKNSQALKSYLLNEGLIKDS